MACRLQQSGFYCVRCAASDALGPLVRETSVRGEVQRKTLVTHSIGTLREKGPPANTSEERRRLRLSKLTQRRTQLTPPSLPLPFSTMSNTFVAAYLGTSTVLKYPTADCRTLTAEGKIKYNKNPVCFVPRE